MESKEIIIGETYYTPSIVYFPVEVKALKVAGDKVETDKGYVYAKSLYKTESECPQR